MRDIMRFIQLNRLFKHGLAMAVMLSGVSLMTSSYAQESKGVYDCQLEAANVIEAIRSGRQATVEAHVQAKCSLPAEDERGFSLYDLAALNGDKEMMAWLVDKGYAKEGEYSEALLKLIQTGLRFLNYDAGVIDGKMNAATQEGISDYQKANKLKQTGVITPDWLRIFDRQLVKKTQSVLGNLGFSAGGADGIIGPNTRTAMQAFRQERSMPKVDYAYIDDQLLYQIMMAENEATKKAIARREAERAARLVAQQAAQQQEIARQRAIARKKAEQARRQAEARAKEAEAQRLANEKALQEEQARIAQLRQTEATQAQQKSAQELALLNQAQAEAEAKRKAEEQRLRAQSAKTAQEKQALQAKMAAIEAQRAEEAKIAARKAAEVEAQRKAAQKAEQARIAQAEAQAKRAAEERRLVEQLAARRAEAARKAEAQAKAEALAAQQAAAKAKAKAREAFKAARSGQAVAISQDVQVGQPIANTGSDKKLTPGVGAFNQLSGRLTFRRENGQLSQCLIGGQAIDSSWCEPYYPAGENKQCEAVVSRTGIVVSMLCK